MNGFHCASDDELKTFVGPRWFLERGHSAAGTCLVSAAVVMLLGWPPVQRQAEDAGVFDRRRPSSRIVRSRRQLSST